MSVTTVLLVSDLADDLKSDLSMVEDLSVIGTAASANHALAMTRSQQPDMVVIDYDVIGEASMAITRTILQENDKAQVIMVSLVQDVTDIRNAMRAGARDYLIKPLDPGELVETIRWLVRERRDYARMSAFMTNLRRAYETMFYDESPVPEHVVRFIEAQAAEKPGDRLTLEALAVAYARNRDWGKLRPLVEKLAAMGTFSG